MKKYTKVAEIRKVLPRLKQATKPGRSFDGRMVSIRYEATQVPTERAKAEAAPAKAYGLDLRTYTGRLERVWKGQKRGLVRHPGCCGAHSLQRQQLRLQDVEHEPGPGALA